MSDNSKNCTFSSGIDEVKISSLSILYMYEKEKKRQRILFVASTNTIIIFLLKHMEVMQLDEHV